MVWLGDDRPIGCGIEWWLAFVESAIRHVMGGINKKKRKKKKKRNNRVGSSRFCQWIPSY